MRDDYPSFPEWWRLAAVEVWLPTAVEMVELDRVATSSGAISERTLIENAGREVARHLQMRWPDGPVLALAGSGHNGADGLVALRTLRAWGRDVRAIRCGRRAPEPDVLTGWDIELEEPETLESVLATSPIVLDGILGTGLTEAPRPAQATLIETVNRSASPVVAVDGPSGADLTSGAVPGACIQARLTVTLGWPKLGLLQSPARDRSGDVVAVEIGFPPPSPTPSARAITAAWASKIVPRRDASAHKGTAGYVTLIAGSAGMGGASVLAARAAVRAGAGIVRVVGDPANREIVQTAVPEAVFVDREDTAAVAEALSWAHAVAVGPGLGRGEAVHALVEKTLAAAGTPVVLDADALNVWEEDPAALADRLGSGAVITPHPGEAARLLGCTVGDITADAPAAARAAADRFGCTVVLKGSPALIALPDGSLRVATLHTPALAAGGTGDILTGLIGAYLAAGAGPADAATVALVVSVLAALEAPQMVGHSAADLPDRIPGARARLDTQLPALVPGVLFASQAPPSRV